MTADGEPIALGMIQFFPETGGRQLGGPLDDEGRIVISLPPGDYRVVIIESAPAPPAGWREGDPLPTYKKVAPAIYAQRNKTPLRLTAPASSVPIEKEYELLGAGSQ